MSLLEASTREIAGWPCGDAAHALTLGPYRFWYVTRSKNISGQHAHRKNTAEFTGRPVDLIVGFFMAVRYCCRFIGLFVVSGLQNAFWPNLGLLS